MPILRVAAVFTALVACISLLFVNGAQAQEQQPGTSQPAPAAQLPPSPQPQKPKEQQLKVVDYSKSQSHFPNPVAPYYKTRDVPEAVLANTPRIEQLFQNGKLMLSLNDAIALALENNLDLAIARYNLNIADTDILRTKAGAATRGVAAGLVQGTPGGGVGGFGTGAQGAGAGGTTGGAGGAGTGAAGLVTSTLGVGSTIDNFDPIISGTISVEHAVFPLSSSFVTGVNQLNQNTTTGNFTYSQGFSTGTAMQLTFNNNRQATNNTRNLLEPAINSQFRLTMRQHLLQGFGFGPNLRFIRIARNNRRISDSAFKQQINSTVSQIQNIYWDLVNAYEDVKVKERSLALANRTLSDNRKQVQIGTLAPIEIVRAEAEVATRQQDLIVSQTNLQLQQSLMKNAITRSLPKGSPLETAEVIPNDTMQLPTAEPGAPVDDLLQQALTNRPELEQSSIDLENRKITDKSAHNALLPSLDVFAFYGGSGLAGDQNPLATCAAPICTPLELAQGQIPPGSINRTGLGNAFARLFDSSAPDKGVGVNLTIPLRNRSAQADAVRSQLEFRQAELRLQQLRNQISIEVRNAQFALQQNRARVEAAQKGRQFAQESLDAEQKRYALGASTNFLVLQAQRDLTQAESNLVAAMAAYEKSRVELDRVTGNTMARNNIRFEEAMVGEVQTTPSVPDVVPQQAPQQPQQPK
jgi:outer membrane protein